MGLTRLQALSPCPHCAHPRPSPHPGM